MPTRAYGEFKLLRGNGASPEVFAVVAYIQSFDGPSTELAFLDATTFSSTGGYREQVPGLRDGGSFDITLLFDPNHSSYGYLEVDHDAEPPVQRTYKVELLTGSEKVTRTFEAYVASIRESGQVDGFLQAQVSLRITGPVTRA
jgi:hypothetical protein